MTTEKPSRGYAYPDSVRQEVVAKGREGRTQLSLAREYEIGVKTIARWLREDRASMLATSRIVGPPDENDAVEVLTLAWRETRQIVDKAFAGAIQAILGGSGGQRSA